MAPAIRDAYIKAEGGVNKVKDWAEANPEMSAVIVTLVALGILALMMPWVLAYLGFAEDGILEGKLVPQF
jgi:hypothetical protein